MIELTKESLRKHREIVKELIEAETLEDVEVQPHTRTSKTGKRYQVAQYDRVSRKLHQLSRIKDRMDQNSQRAHPWSRDFRNLMDKSSRYSKAMQRLKRYLGT